MGKRLDKIRVEQVMASPPVIIHDKNSLYDTIKAMYEANTGSILVVNDDNKLTGIITERDVIRLAAMRIIEKNPVVKNVMTVDPITVGPKETLSQALTKMREAGVRHLPVVNDRGEPIGIITQRDVLETILEALLAVSFPETLKSPKRG